MDELLIEDKKYVSSKRAAKMTGYAKDYIGQLCREGRVSARLVGRSWYVLESAIQDHRFGSEIQPEEAMKAVFSPEPPVEPMRQQSTPEEFLPPINRLREAAIEAENTEEAKAAEHLIDSWRDWFDRIADTETAVLAEKGDVQEEKVPEVVAQAVTVDEIVAVEPESVTESTKEEETEVVNVPVRALYQQPPEELLPRSIQVETRSSEEIDEPVEEEEAGAEWRTNKTVVRSIQVAAVAFAMIFAVIAFVGTGYLDTYIISNSQVRIIAGVGVYNK